MTGFQVAVSQFNGGRARYPKKLAFRYDLYVQKRVDLTYTQQLMFLSPILWVIAVTTIRAAIIFLYVQIFPTRLFRNVCYAALAANVAFGATAVIADCLICQPIRYRWAPSMVHGSCGDQKSLDMYIAILNLLQDIVIVVLPIPILWRLQMARSKKMGVIGIFGVGIMYAFSLEPDQILMASKHGTLTHFFLQDMCHHNLPRPGDLHDRRPNQPSRSRYILPCRVLDLYRSPPRSHKRLLACAQTITSQISGLNVRAWDEHHQVFHVRQHTYRSSCKSNADFIIQEALL